MSACSLRVPSTFHRLTVQRGDFALLSAEVPAPKRKNRIIIVNNNILGNFYFERKKSTLGYIDLIFL